MLTGGILDGYRGREGGSYKAYDDGYNALCGTDTGWQADNYGSSKEVLTRH